jgi:glycosyltransferase involved in cell wall biosynthesis
LFDDAKWSAYRDADLFVLPSQNENFGNTAAEAVACDTPVLVTDQCGVAPLVDGRAGLVVPHDREALTAALDRLLGQPGLLEQLERGCAGVAQSLSWQEPLDETQALYAELTRGKQT